MQESENTRVTGKLHGGPYDGDRVDMDHAWLKLDLPDWDGPFLEDWGIVSYRLRSRWKGGRDADYDFIEPIVLDHVDQPAAFVRVVEAEPLVTSAAATSTMVGRRRMMLRGVVVVAAAVVVACVRGDLLVRARAARAEIRFVSDAVAAAYGELDRG